jgi:hypothetical protein
LGSRRRTARDGYLLQSGDLALDLNGDWWRLPGVVLLATRNPGAPAPAPGVVLTGRQVAKPSARVPAFEAYGVDQRQWLEAVRFLITLTKSWPRMSVADFLSSIGAFSAK